jgi:hypothetical protein
VFDFSGMHVNMEIEMEMHIYFVVCVLSRFREMCIYYYVLCVCVY